MSDETRPSKNDRRVPDPIAEALGASVVVPLGTDPVQVSPQTLGDLARQFERRLESAGGRPTDPRWETTRQVPFALSTWDRLGRVADALSEHGRRIARGQLAAVLVESGLSQLESNVRTRPEELDAFLAMKGHDPDN